MNAISYICGDAQITDFPACSARPLAALVQACNDLLAGPDGYLSPANSLLALELGWQTVGTADVADSVIHAWVAELLTSPTWGVVRYAKITAIKAIVDIAQLHRNVASGRMPPSVAWAAAEQVARVVARSINPTLNPVGLCAARAAYHSIAIVDTHHHAALDAVTGNALLAYIFASGDTAKNRGVELTRRAIHSWRQLAGLDRTGSDSTASSASTSSASTRNDRGSRVTPAGPDISRRHRWVSVSERVHLRPLSNKAGRG
jgi:hypothetical protein